MHCESWGRDDNPRHRFERAQAMLEIKIRRVMVVPLRLFLYALLPGDHSIRLHQEYPLVGLMQLIQTGLAVRTARRGGDVGEFLVEHRLHWSGYGARHLH